MNLIIKVQRDIKKTQTKLIGRCKKKGIYENFGQKEVRELTDKWVNISDYYQEMNQIRQLILDFGHWCSSYNGE